MYDNSNQGRNKPVFFQNEQQLRDAWITAGTLAFAVGALVFLLWGVL